MLANDDRPAMIGADMLTLREAADLASVSRDTIWRAGKRGEIESVLLPGRRGKHMLLKRADVELWLQKRGTTAQTVEASRPVSDASQQPSYASHGASEATHATELPSEATQAHASQPPHASLRTDSTPPRPTWDPQRRVWVVGQNTCADDGSDVRSEASVQDPSDASQPVSEASQAASDATHRTRVSSEASQDVSDASQASDSRTHVPMVVHLETLRLLEGAQNRVDHLLDELCRGERERGRVERERDGLMEVLGRQRLALEENAQSLIERESRARVAEARAAEAEEARQRALAAEEKAQRLMEEVETLKQSMSAPAEAPRPPWWKRWFANG